MFDIEKIDIQRQTYVSLFVLTWLTSTVFLIWPLISTYEYYNIALIFLAIAFILNLFFLYFFMRVVKVVFELQVYLAIVIGLIFLFTPVVSTIFMAFLDNRIYTFLEAEEERATRIVKPKFDGLTVWSIVFAVLPYVGLIIVIYAIRRILSSKGHRTGLIVGFISLAINLLSTYIYSWLIISLVAESVFE